MLLLAVEKYVMCIEFDKNANAMNLPCFHLYKSDNKIDIQLPDLYFWKKQ